MLKFNKLNTVIGVILINILAISCGCSESSQDKERKELKVQEKQLRDKLKSHFKSEPWKKLEDDIKKEKNDLTKVDAAIEEIKHLLEVIEKLENGNLPNLNKIPERFLMYFFSLKGVNVKFSLSNLNNPMALLEQLEQVFSNPATITKAKQATLDALTLYENFKKQLELKNKGKKPKEEDKEK